MNKEKKDMQLQHTKLSKNRKKKEPSDELKDKGNLHEDKDHSQPEGGKTKYSCKGKSAREGQTRPVDA